jgi:hypothetical protein
MITTLRREMEGFVADIGSALPSGGRRPLGGHRRLVEDRTAPSENGSHSPRRAERGGTHAEVERMIVEQVAALHREGRSRAEAERFVMRFKQGEDYFHVLDRVYR